jgi:hypothetical protein
VAYGKKKNPPGERVLSFKMNSPFVKPRFKGHLSSRMFDVSQSTQPFIVSPGIRIGIL